MSVNLCGSLSDDDTLFLYHKKENEISVKIRKTGSEPDLHVIKRFQKRKASKLRKKWLNEFYASLSPEKLDQMLKKRKKRSGKGEKEEEESASYKYGRLAMIALALFSIPVDGWKLYQEIGRTERSLDGPTSIEVFDYYSSAITTHVIGLAAAVDNNLIITIGCRMLSTVLYQSSYGSKGNTTVPTDPKQLQKYIRENVPKHRLPKGYRFTDDPDPGKTGKKRKKSSGKRGTKKSSGMKSKKSTKTKSKKSTKSAAKSQQSAKKKKKAGSRSGEDTTEKKKDKKSSSRIRGKADRNKP
jgi:hypothetical protein